MILRRCSGGDLAIFVGDLVILAIFCGCVVILAIIVGDLNARMLAGAMRSD